MKTYLVTYRCLWGHENIFFVLKKRNIITNVMTTRGITINGALITPPTFISKTSYTPNVASTMVLLRTSVPSVLTLVSTTIVINSTPSRTGFPRVMQLLHLSATGATTSLFGRLIPRVSLSVTQQVVILTSPMVTYQGTKFTTSKSKSSFKFL